MLNSRAESYAANSTRSLHTGYLGGKKKSSVLLPLALVLVLNKGNANVLNWPYSSEG